MTKNYAEHAKTLDYLKDILGLDYFTANNGADGGVLPFTFNPAVSPTKMVVVTGINATGKSFFRRIVNSYGAWKEPAWYPVHLSMEKRSGADFTEPSMRALIFGDESRSATGAISGDVVLKGIKHARDHIEGKTPCSSMSPTLVFLTSMQLTRVSESRTTLRRRRTIR